MRAVRCPIPGSRGSSAALPGNECCGPRRAASVSYTHLTLTCTLDGVLRGILPDGTPVHKGMKAGDIDPRCKVEHCYTASDKALAIGGGVLEAILDLTGALKDRAGGYSG